MKANMKKVPGLLWIPVLVFIDQITKYWAENSLKENGPIDIIRGVLEFRYLTNKGSAWGMLSGQVVFFCVVAVAAVVILGIVYFRIPAEKKYYPLELICLVLISGATGNLIDRLVNQYVIDFIYVSCINFPIFNVADMYVTISAFLLVFLLFTRYKEDEFDFLKIRRNKDKK